MSKLYIAKCLIDYKNNVLAEVEEATLIKKDGTHIWFIDSKGHEHKHHLKNTSLWGATSDHSTRGEAVDSVNNFLDSSIATVEKRLAELKAEELELKGFISALKAKKLT